jgi:hypothetical protein
MAKQPSKLKSRWSSLAKSLEKKQKDGLVNLSLDSLLLAYKIRKVYYTPLKQSERSLVAA